MKSPAILFVVLIGFITLHSCTKSGNDLNKSSNKTDTTKKIPPVILPLVTVTTTPLNILLPENCAQSFTIKNTGPMGSMLNYTVTDNGALGGFLDFNNSPGSLAANESITINVSVKAAFVSSTPSLVGASLVLNVNTPQASNFIKTPVPVNIKSISTIVPLFIGTWAGTWTGTSMGRNNPTEAQPSSPVSGTWTLTLKTLDTTTMTATGSLKWIGTDAYWTYLVNAGGLITKATPNLFVPDRTIQFDASNAAFTYSNRAAGCSSIHLTVEGFKNFPNPSDGFYGPWFSADFDIGSNMVITIGNGFSTHPYAPSSFDTNVSSGTVSGKKQ
jgi:hypothetical protein